MSRTREVVERVGGRFPFPDDAFDRLTRRRRRKQRNQRIGAGALVLVWVLAIVVLVRAFGTGPVPADRSPRSNPEQGVSRPSPAHDPDTHKSRQGKTPFDGEPAGAITMTASSSCTLDPVKGPINARYVLFGLSNESEQLAIFDIGRIAEGHTFDELAADVESARGTASGGGPVGGVNDALGQVQDGRPGYFQGSIFGDVSLPHGGGGGSSLVEVLPGLEIVSTRTWSGPQTYRPPFGHGTWAVICYQHSEVTGDVTPVGVVGPVEVE